MAWTLKIWPTNKAGDPKTITNLTPLSGIQGGFSWKRQPTGDCTTLDFQARNDRLAVPPRGVVQLLVNGVSQFYGLCADPPSLGSPDAETVTVLGGKEALRKTYSDGAQYQGRVGVYTIVRDLLSRLCPPALTYDAKLVGDGTGTDTGGILSTFYQPFQPLTDVLDSLAKLAGTSWSVDELGRIQFGRAAPAATVRAYAGQQWQRLQVHGSETVTRAILRIVTGPSLPSGASQNGGNPASVVAVATHAQHGTYRAEEAFSVPDGTSVLTTVYAASVGNGTNVDASGAMDQNTTTYSSITLGRNQNGLVLNAPSGVRPVGVVIDYSLQQATDTPNDAFVGVLSSGRLTAGWPLTNTNGARRLERVILPPYADDGNTWRMQVGLATSLAIIGGVIPGGELRVYGVQFYLVDEALAQQVAATFLQVPFELPAQMTLAELISPTLTLTVTGSPDGDVTGPTELWEYEHSESNVATTRVRLGSDGASPAARAIRFLARKGGA